MPANINSPQQTVVSGYKEASKNFSWLEKNIETSFRAIPLKVSAPFHSTLMSPAQSKLRNILKSINFPKIRIPYIANIDAKIYETGTSPDQIKNELYRTKSREVFFGKSAFHKYLKILFVWRLGPGKTLMGLGRSINKNIKVISL